MSEISPPPPGASFDPPVVDQPRPPLPQVAPHDEDRRARQQALLREIGTSAALVALWFAAVGLVGALVWREVTPLPTFTRIGTTGSMDEEQLSHQFSINGWFLVIAVVGGLLSGVALLLIRRRSPVVMVLLVALGGGLATLLMTQCGLAWGPADPSVALAHAQLGDKIPIRLEPDVNAVYFAWSIAALLGAAFALWVLDSAAGRKTRAAADQPLHAG